VCPDAAIARESAADRSLDLIATLADEVGPRRPTSRAERLAAQVVAEAISSRGAGARIEAFRGYASFGYPYGLITGLACAPALLPRRWRLARGILTGLAAAALASEGSLTRTPLSDLLSRRESANVTATIEPRQDAERTLCLISHLDSSRSGLLFDPRLGGLLSRWITLQSVATLLLAAEPLLVRARGGRSVVAAARSVCGLGLALLIERELRGVDVPGANDNASGVGVVCELAAAVTAERLETTRLVVLIAGCEESGLLGTRAFLRERDTRGWLFLNFDGVGAPATLRYATSEGVLRKWDADRRLVELASRVSREHPELALEPADGPIGLTYDATAVLARGGRALTFVAGDSGRIPNYHQPSDTVANLDPETLARALEAGREMIAAIDRGEADPP
jgi:hypothetical protein